MNEIKLKIQLLLFDFAFYSNVSSTSTYFWYKEKIYFNIPSENISAIN